MNNSQAWEKLNQRLFKSYGRGFFAVYKRAQRLAAHADTLTALWQKLKAKNVDLKKVLIGRLPPGHWHYQI